MLLTPIGGSTEFGFLPQPDRARLVNIISTTTTVFINWEEMGFNMLYVLFNSAAYHRMFKSLFATTVLYVLFGVGAALAYSGDDSSFLGTRFENSAKQDYVADISIKDEEGRNFRLLDIMKSQFKGRYILLNIWASWCAPCVKEMKYLNKAQEKLGNAGLTVIALSEDKESAKVSAFYRWHSLSNLKIFLDSDGYATAKLGFYGIPATVLISPEGREIGRVSGDLDWSREDNLAFLNNIITKSDYRPAVTKP